jgi:hypothetical protein
MASIIKTIALGIIVTFALFGVFVFSTLLHEFSHYQDFKEIASNNEICALTIPTDLSYSTISNLEAGYYKFSIDPENEQEYNNISKYTEIKAYSIDAAMGLFLIFCIFIVVLKE